MNEFSLSLLERQFQSSDENVTIVWQKKKRKNGFKKYVGNVYTPTAQLLEIWDLWDEIFKTIDPGWLLSPGKRGSQFILAALYKPDK